jgi:hypothetical protein
MSGLDADIEKLYRQRHRTFKAMLASLTGVISAAAPRRIRACRGRSPRTLRGASERRPMQREIVVVGDRAVEPDETFTVTA